MPRLPRTRSLRERIAFRIYCEALNGDPAVQPFVRATLSQYHWDTERDEIKIQYYNAADEVLDEIGLK